MESRKLKKISVFTSSNQDISYDELIEKKKYYMNYQENIILALQLSVICLARCVYEARIKLTRHIWIRPCGTKS